MPTQKSVEMALATVLTICAVVVTGLFVRREFGAQSPGGRVEQGRAVPNWTKYATGIEVVGPNSAKNTIVVFSDFQCPFCAQFASTLERLRDSAPNAVRIFHRNLPLDAIHPYARKAAVAGLCAAEQGKFSEYFPAAFAQRDSFSVLNWNDLGRQVGVANQGAFETCLSDGRTDTLLASDSVDASELGISGTPGVIVNGRQWSGALPYDTLLAVLQDSKE